MALSEVEISSMRDISPLEIRKADALRSSRSVVIISNGKIRNSASIFFDKTDDLRVESMIGYDNGKHRRELDEREAAGAEFATSLGLLDPQIRTAIFKYPRKGAAGEERLFSIEFHNPHANQDANGISVAYIASDGQGVDDLLQLKYAGTSRPLIEG